MLGFDFVHARELERAGCTYGRRWRRRRWRPQGCREGYVDKLVSVALIGIQPVGNVALLGQARQPHDANALRLAMQRLRGLKRFLAPCLVVVFEDQDVTACERVDAVVRPVTARDRGRAVIERRNTLSIFLAFPDKDAAVWILQQFRQAVWDAAAAFHAPYPTAFAIRSPLAEVFRLKPADLIEQLALVVGVVVSRDDVALRLAAGGLGGNDLADVECWFALAVRFERLDACFASDVVLACNRIVPCERVNDEAVRCTRVEFDGEAAVIC